MNGFTSDQCNANFFPGGASLAGSKVCEVANIQETGTLPAPSACYQGDSCPTVDLAKIPLGSPGTDEMRVRATTQQPGAGDGTGSFRVICDFSHMAFNDPLIYPGQGGRSHLHAFFGNTGVNANSTAESIANSGASTCHGGVANRSAYWIPALIDTRSGQPLVPTDPIWYYKSGYQGPRPEQLSSWPAGLRMIAGDAMKRDAQSTRTSNWNCTGVSGPFPTLPNCAVGQYVEMRVFFPQCWDGRNLDSPDHKSHMAYGNGTGCPATHPVAIPEITLNVRYLVRNANDPLHWKLSSDMPNLPAGITAHADWVDGWVPSIKDTFVNNCDKARRDCHADLLGDGRTLY
ncbi:MAG: DUF1996 domain-containing protein [Cytophagales bacterium]|nr:DUF1996 domain-containing protein [Rhizobacter sp.]